MRASLPIEIIISLDDVHKIHGRKHVHVDVQFKLKDGITYRNKKFLMMIGKGYCDPGDTLTLDGVESSFTFTE